MAAIPGFVEFRMKGSIDRSSRQSQIMGNYIFDSLGCYFLGGGGGGGGFGGGGAGLGIGGQLF
jgi:hypothetical protein